MPYNIFTETIPQLWNKEKLMSKHVHDENINWNFHVGNKSPKLIPNNATNRYI